MHARGRLFFFERIRKEHTKCTGPGMHAWGACFSLGVLEMNKLSRAYAYGFIYFPVYEYVNWNEHV